jgi:N-acetylmuramoyl-L-alanine amidase
MCAAGKPKRAVELTPWQVAESAKQQLLTIPMEQRTAEDYRTVMDGYRLIYHDNPGDVHAPEAIYDVGLLLEEQGTAQHQPKTLQAAIGQFEFLRKQYPQSSMRIAALFQEGHVAMVGLRDVKLARAKYSDFVEQYPQSAHVEEAQAALKQLRAGVLPALPDAAPATPQVASSSDLSKPAVRGSAAASGGVPGSAVSSEVHAEASRAASQPVTISPLTQPGVPARKPSTDPIGQPVQDASAQVPAHTRNGLATVSAIRHWSTPTYTRVAIDLGDEVQYEAARVPSPDRIYFDLHGTRLAQELAGKSFTVTDDGFLKRIRAAQYSDNMTRVVLDVNDVTEYSAFLLPNPYRLIIDIHGGARSAAASPVAAPVKKDADKISGSDLLAPPSQMQASVAAGQRGASVASSTPTAPTAGVRVASVPSTLATRSTSSGEVAGLGTAPDTQRGTSQPTSQPIAVVSTGKVAAAKRSKSSDKIVDSTPAHVAGPTADGERTLQRALGLKIGRIVIDAGHGGHDSGTIGAGGLMEKDVVLDVALRLGQLLHDKLGAEIIYTRSDDTFIPLETRTAIANKAEADLFISVHANSSGDETARGVETYYLNFTTQPDALDVAARENAVSDGGVHQLADLVKKITLKDKIDESREFASDVEQSLYDGLHKGNEGLKNRGVKKAPFVVLIGANMPSILTEISFVTNGKDAAQLRTPEYRERVAESIFHGVATYANGMSGMRLASAAKVTPHGE